MNDTVTEQPQDPSPGETLGAMLGKMLGELEQLGVRVDAVRVGELRGELEERLTGADVPANIRAAALAAELARELEAEPMLLRMVGDELSRELGERLELDDAEPTARLEGEG